MLSRIITASSGAVARATSLASPSSAAFRSMAVMAVRAYSAESDSQSAPSQGIVRNNEQRPQRQFNDERRQYDGERRPRQFDGERRPRQYNNNNNTNGEGRPRRQFTPRPDGASSPMTDLDKFRDRVANGNSINAWKLYLPLATMQPDSLTFMDHVKLMGLFRLSNLGPDFDRMRTIFSNLEKGQFDIPAPIYETMIGKAWRVSPELTEEYYAKLVAKHGQGEVSVMTYANRMNAYRSAKQFDKVLELAQEAERASINTHQLLPIVMDAYWHKGDEPKAKELFEAYVAREGQNLNLCKIHAWMGNNLIDQRRGDEARKLIAKLPERDIRLNSGAFGVLARAAILEGNLVEARQHTADALKSARRETYSHTVTVVVDAHLKAKDIQGLHEFLQVYTAKYEEVPNQRFRPYMQLIEWHAANDKDIGAIRAAFDMIPTRSKFNNPALLKCMMVAYIKCGHAEKARQLLEAAHKLGFNAQHPAVNMAWLKSVVEENGGDWEATAPQRFRREAARATVSDAAAAPVAQQVVQTEVTAKATPEPAEAAQPKVADAPAAAAPAPAAAAPVEPKAAEATPAAPRAPAVTEGAKA
ncbi:hypothetical protein BCR44DRAFT_69139 [Catenaria anguillulae PL171]|uniref:Pentacotripeptide-repeat region of PRORP domain-containing protein n=1 Tax=Catenaria anguillulae PL171 TaxID=765915 RepID=A0A1Y2HWR3_9FUNG|nr:hypothetical protein BCR44DRAFT_69139 [Catenaria anguillulae PL171]